ncbi:LruC domain-containing protein [Parabacteroides chinchillae]|uniref:LruC domain-containing protein n=1 Tax=Parabacteroides chinchillae TaxID=871327 RepID=A0A8G2BTS6_9BACT|nr:LruC domain-containing protein [Parabacteroides chinchillae]SEF44039.1 LruC domain-containing protein [Parabacteroides chinchillae]
MKCILKKRAIFFIPVLMILFFACTKDVYEGEDPKKPDSGNTSGIPDDFDFTTVKKAKLTVDVNDQFNGKYFYVVEVYDANPFASKSANLLGKGVGKKDAPFVVDLIYPLILKNVYVKQTDPLQRESVKACDATVDVINCTFGSVAATKSLSDTNLRSGTVLSASDYPLPADYTDLSDVSDGYQLQNGNYYIPEGVLLNASKLKSYWAGNSALYVAGTVTLTNWYMANNDKIIVLPGGKVIINSMSGGTIGQSNTMVAVHGSTASKSEGSIEFTSGSIQVDPGATIINDGTLIAKTLKINGKVINNGTMEITKNGSGGNFDQLLRNASLVMAGSTSYFENNGHCSSATFGSVQGAILINSCSLDIENKMYCDGTDIELVDGSLFKCDEFKGNGLNVNMFGSAVVKIEKSATFVWNNKIIGHNVDQFIPTIMMKSYIGGSGEGSAFFGGILNLICLSDFSGDCKMEQGVTLSRVPVNAVAPTTCNDDGIEENPGSGTPSDPKFPIEVALSTYYIFAMEDGWPGNSDYDMNDLVLGVKNFIYSQDKDNNVVSMEINLDMRALGATKKLGAGVQLDKVIPSSIKSVTRTALNDISVNNYFVSSGNGVEGSSYAVIPLFGNAHAAFGVPNGQITNTYKGADAVVSGNILCKIDFTAPVAMENVNVNALNFFIVNGGDSNNRSEVHLAGRIPTEKVKGDTNGYKSDDNMMWGFMIPYDDFKYPLEGINIMEAYPTFANWCKSGGTQDTDWYKHPVDDKVFTE